MYKTHNATHTNLTISYKNMVYKKREIKKEREREKNNLHLSCITMIWVLYKTYLVKLCHVKKIFVTAVCSLNESHFPLCINTETTQDNMTSDDSHLHTNTPHLNFHQYLYIWNDSYQTQTLTYTHFYTHTHSSIKRFPESHMDSM